MNDSEPDETAGTPETPETPEDQIQRFKAHFVHALSEAAVDVTPILTPDTDNDGFDVEGVSLTFEQAKAFFELMGAGGWDPNALPDGYHCNDCMDCPEFDKDGMFMIVDPDQCDCKIHHPQ